MFQLIPAIDILGGKVVRLTEGDYDQVTVYSDDPVQFALQWAVFGLIHLVDLDGAKAGRPINLETIKKIRKSVHCQLEVGGGIRTEASAKILLDLGIDRIILGSIALKDKALTEKLVKKYKEKIVIGIDAKNGLVATEGWLETSTTSVEQLVVELEKIGVKNIIYTDIARDGMLSGPNLDAYRTIVNKTRINIIASGGIGNIKDIQNLKNIKKLGGTIIGKALYENKITIQELLEMNKLA